MAEKKGKLSELIPDDKNLNKHTQYGMSLLEKSVRGHKFGRSILVDRNNRIIAGNGIVETAANIGAEDIRIIETTGEELVVVKRTDVDLDTKEGREMALADNATSAADLEWDDDTLLEVSDDFDIDPTDWGVDMPEDKPLKPKTLELKPFEQNHVLISYPIALHSKVMDAIECLRDDFDITINQSAN